ncbi:hypothetical protein M902_2360 [Bacteriovorax sp. BAL6_X]|uniref:hypothetical protein n=1 Tax=Bacteriovorax sp. BAL6_X TaxID=1201290 RepID=UPI0003866A48|nr:hypothetical protein [Bacteriovorax sp. BAL6_X]EPZ52363.1 hypothetical protein M902_2360 [Bacteriovorax sp. BAL6_X]
MYRIILLLSFLFSFSALASGDDFLNRLTIGNFGFSTGEGYLYSVDALRVFKDKHSFIFRTNQASDSSQSDYLAGYRYYWADKASHDSWFSEVGYRWGRDVDYSKDFDFVTGTFYDVTEIEKKESIDVTSGYQFVFFDQMTFEYSVGYAFNIKDSERGGVTGTISIGCLF